MKLLVFSTVSRKLIRFTIDGRKVVYFDDNWKEGIQIYPLNKLLVRKMALSRKPSISAMGLLIIEANEGDNLKQYNDCKTEEDIAEMIRTDCLSKGLMEAAK